MSFIIQKHKQLRGVMWLIRGSCFDSAKVSKNSGFCKELDRKKCFFINLSLFPEIWLFLPVKKCELWITSNTTSNLQWPLKLHWLMNRLWNRLHALKLKKNACLWRSQSALFWRWFIGIHEFICEDFHFAYQVYRLEDGEMIVRVHDAVHSLLYY